MKRLLARFALLLPVPLLVVATTWTVDPANIKNDDSYETGIARLLLSGKNVANLGNYKERKLQQMIAAGRGAAPQVMVLGSSRTMPVNASFFPGRTFFNHSVSGASLEDDLAIFNLYRKKGFLPETVVLGLDPWLLNAHNGQIRWQDLRDDCAEMRSLLEGVLPGAPRSLPTGLRRLLDCRKYLEFASPGYFNQSVYDLMANRGARRPYWGTDRNEADQTVKLTDGSYLYGRDARERPVAEVNRDAARYLEAKSVYSLGDFRVLDPALLRLLDNFIGYLGDHGVKVLLFLPPYHPAVYDGMARDTRYAMVRASEEAFRRLALRHRVTLIGSFDPRPLQLQESDFYDGMHPRPGAIGKLFAAAASDTARRTHDSTLPHP